MDAGARSTRVPRSKRVWTLSSRSSPRPSQTRPRSAESDAQQANLLTRSGRDRLGERIDHARPREPVGETAPLLREHHAEIADTQAGEGEDSADAAEGGATIARQAAVVVLDHGHAHGHLAEGLTAAPDHDHVIGDVQG